MFAKRPVAAPQDDAHRSSDWNSTSRFQKLASHLGVLNHRASHLGDKPQALFLINATNGLGSFDL
jgi:hypothetical protein